MKQNILLPLAGLVLLLSACAPKPSATPYPAADLFTLLNAQTAYDSSLAQNLHADPYGMQRYVMAFLKKGPKRDQDSVTVARLQKAHLDNIGRLAESGKLVLAGPFLDNGEVRGIYIFNVATVEEARELTATDPAIQAGRLEMELHPWYGSASLPLINPLHKRLSKQKIGG